ncbi:hypothetical protein [Actinomadura bangladeshensis]|jgi:hypothetical protein|uniref:Methyltransferase domain-containing protein n=1 Tax=Actinomadura bangladeshensis TaxID=453573 RepID=A0A6L9QI04_9ACTN|nr:hypothetical protein [Actinomadura bangladeshensis]NEA25077.1 hypothetical protein [Actinomadura bangladeshensis]
MTDWDEFESAAYVSQNYGGGILSEDMQIMRFVLAELRDLAFAPGSLRAAADVGAGPNLYPGLLLAPYVATGGVLELIDRSASNLRYLRDVIGGGDGGRDAADAAVWAGFEDHLRALGHRTSVRQLRDVAAVRPGSIFELPAGRYDAVMSFFVAESITDDPAEFATALDSLLGSLKPGGLFITAHMIGSTGYSMKPGVCYPACELSMAEVEESYRPYGEFRSILTSPGPGEAVRAGYQGMAALVGRRSA